MTTTVTQHVPLRLTSDSHHPITTLSTTPPTALPLSKYTPTTPLLLAPGPTEVAPAVLAALASPAESHLTLAFAQVFSTVLRQVRRLFLTSSPDSQPFVLGGSGSLGWDFVATNFLPTGSPVLCLSTGFFSDAFASCLAAYGQDVTVLRAPDVGATVDLAEVEAALATGKYKALVATHVETSTAVRTNLPALRALLDRVSPTTLFIADAVASLGAEELRFDEWGLDIVLSGSQKAIGCPPGLSLLMVSGRAMALALDESVTDRPRTWYASLPRWLPVMRKYEAGEPGYFATPPTQVVRALGASLQLMHEVGMERTWELHRVRSAQVKEAAGRLGLRLLAQREEDQSHAVTALWLPEGIEAKALLARVLARGVTLAAGMHVEVGTRYVRFGHMGYSITGNEGHIEMGIRALSEALLELYAERREKEVAEQESQPSAGVLEAVRQEVAVADG
ncbi:uncharacterized protein HMPREF1541_03548 [Cyphellophora europaea CBS 101466]|uniref:Aminotransferase class V domain-containing protein n=1 Tax=Cyphellophora europaea (strain CBS 101466) TaxID=1220924 RepID=W2RYT5_CYPE1|nr:uncharacterized protein HMPREF1541_03548 [Cyphellophora europaea CBS 101466]ETN41612.1 hypothetical protein HMPREF1541_03548 [Cyphellophora europaea CBS 101466]